MRARLRSCAASAWAPSTSEACVSALFVLNACGDALERHAGEWPPGFFDLPETEGDRAALIEAAAELERDVAAKRMNRGSVIL